MASTKGPYTTGLRELGDGCFAYLQPDGGWGWSNAGLIVGDGDPNGHAACDGHACVACVGSGIVAWTRNPPPADGATAPHLVVLADYVTTEDSTGLVHQSPAFGADDLAVGRSYGLPVVNPIDPSGHFLAEVPLVGGHFFKAADPALVRDLHQDGDPAGGVLPGNAWFWEVWRRWTAESRSSPP